MLALRDIWLLDLFLAVVDCGSMTSAAKARNVTTPTVSDAMTKLESLTGASLLIRSSTGCAPTAHGQEVLRVARAMLNDVDARLQELPGNRVETYRVGTVYGGRNRLLARLSQIDGAPKLIGVSMQIDDPAPAVFDGSVDMALVLGPTRLDHELDRHYVFTEPRVAILDASIAPDGDNVTLSYLDQFTWPALPPGADQTYMKPWICYDVRPGWPPNQGAVAADVFALRDWAMSNPQQAVVATTPAIAQFFANATGAVILPIVDVPGWDSYLIAPKNSRHRAHEVAELLRGNAPQETHVDRSKIG